MRARSIDVQLRRGDEDTVVGRFSTVEGLSGRNHATEEPGCLHRLFLGSGEAAHLGSMWRSSGRGTSARSSIVHVVITAVDGSILGRYGFRLERWVLHEQGEAVDLELIGTLLTGALPYVETVWAAWSDGLPTTFAWRPLDFEHRMAWLEVARSRFHQPLVPEQRDAEFHLYGTQCVDYPAFFCALGESFFGAGGYMGADLDGLADSLVTMSSVTQRLRLVWHGSGASRQWLDGDAFDRALDYRRQAAASWDEPAEDVAQAGDDRSHREPLFAALVALLTELGVSVTLVDD